MEICRVCESNQVRINLTNVGSKIILKKLLACADITFDFSDPLPKSLCQKCIENLEFAYKFKIQCEYTDQKLRDALFTSKTLNNADEIHSISLKSIDPEIKEEVSLDINNEDNRSKDKPNDETEYVNDTENANVGVNIVEFEGVAFEDYSNIEYSEAENLNDEENVNNIEEHLDESEADKSDGDHEEYLSEKSEEIDENEIYFAEEDDANYDEINEKDDQEPHQDEPDEGQVNEDNENFGEEIERTICFQDDNQHSDFNQPKDDRNIDECQVSSTLAGPSVHSKEYYLDAKKSKRFTCDTCGEDFLIYSEFNQHKKTHGNQRYQCSQCGKWFSKRYHLKNHQLIHEGVKNYDCKLCKKRYTNQGNLDRHIRVFHNKEKSYICSECGKGFSQSNTLKQHCSVHIQERTHECDVCHKRYKTEFYLNIHKIRHQPKEQRKQRSVPAKKYPPKKKTCICTYCGKRSNSVAVHRSHIRTHTGEKPFECRVCKKRFAFHQSLKSHLLLHTGEKPYKCDRCDLSFRQIGHLKGHQLVHSGVKQHKCLICPKTFALRGNLTVHMRLHTGETPYHCNVCPKKFYDSNGLKRHRQVHSRSSIDQIVNVQQLQQPVELQLDNQSIDVSTLCVDESPSAELIDGNTKAHFIVITSSGIIKENKIDENSIFNY